MGKRNRERRADKRRRDERREARRRSEHRPPRAAWDRDRSPEHVAAILVATALDAAHQGDADGVRRAAGSLDALGATDGRPAGCLMAELVLRDLIGRLWSAGWQPTELVRAARRQVGARAATLAVDAIADHTQVTAASPVDPRWQAQLDDLAAHAWWHVGAVGWLTARAGLDGVARVEVLAAALSLAALFERLPALAVLLPPPGTVAAQRPTRASADRKVLERVRALLAKAESTTFPAEAEALSAKAQELMARHALGSVLVGGATDDVPEARRLPVDDPYADAKALLLHVVAKANRCRTVRDTDLGLVTLFGFEVDLDAVEVLFTSLLTQATAALVASGRAAPARRTASYRRSFLTAYAARIGQRLAAATQAVVDDVAAADGGFLPVLASRRSAVDELCEQTFPTLVASRPTRVSNVQGWVAGTQAADRARLASELADPAATVPGSEA